MKSAESMTPAEFLAFLESEEPVIRRYNTAMYAPEHKVRMSADFARISHEIDGQVEAARAASNGSNASDWRAAQTFLKSVLSELLMWIAVADKNASDAWNHFCTAEIEADWTVRFLSGFGPAVRQVEHLREVERVVFPHQPKFCSIALLIAEGGEECTICRRTYGECEHVAGELYDGEIALRAVTKIDDCLEISLVDQPADKRCRLISVEGVDPLTGLPPVKERVERKPRHRAQAKRRPNKKKR